MKKCEYCGNLFFPNKFYPNQRYCSFKCNVKQYQRTHKEEIKEQQKQYREANKEKIRKQQKQYYEAHKEQERERKKERDREYTKIHKEQQKQYVELNKDKINKWRREYRKIHKNPKTQLHSSLGTAIYIALKSKGLSKKGYSWEKIVGYTTQDLMEHLERQFKAGMNWDNYGKWHVDHINPKCSFDFTSYEDNKFQECWSLKNLQPLWAQENLKKGKKILWAQEKIRKPKK